MIGVPTLALFATGFLGVGVGLGVMWHHFALGWFISLCSKQTLEEAVERAGNHLTRRVERRDERERRRRILVENGHGWRARRERARIARAVISGRMAPPPARHLRQ